MKVAKKILVIFLALVLSIGSMTLLFGCGNKGNYTITFLPNAEDVYCYDDNGQKVPVSQSGIVQRGVDTPKQIKSPVFVRRGFNFNGWDKPMYEELKSDKEFKALWVQHKLTVTYDGNGGLFDGKGIIEITDITNGLDAFERAPKFVKEGYELSWDMTELDFVKQVNSFTVNAVWTPIDNQLIFKDYYGNDFANNTMDITYGQKIEEFTVETPQIVGKKFTHWVDEQGMPVDKGTIWNKSTGAILSPCYTDQDNYVIHYDLNGGQSEMDRKYWFNETYQSLPISNAKREGYSFAGWSINGSTELKMANQITMEDVKINGQFSDITLKAEWSADQYYLDFDPQGGTISNSNPLKVIYGQKITGLPTVEKQGVVFVGWEYNGQIIKDGMISEFKQNVTLVAKFSGTYTIKFDLTTYLSKSYKYAKVECTLSNWGDLPHQAGQSIQEIEIKVLEGKSLVDSIENFRELPVVVPKMPDEYKYRGKWMWRYNKDSKPVYIEPDTKFTSQLFANVPAGGTITIVPYCSALWTPAY